MEDRNEYSHASDGDGWTEELATDTYIDRDSTSNLQKVRIIFEARCDNGVGWRVTIKTDSGGSIYDKHGTNTSYAEFDSGWQGLSNTKKLHIYVGAYQSGLDVDTGYVRRIRIYVR